MIEYEVKKKYEYCIDNISVLYGSLSLFRVAAFLLSLRRFLSSFLEEERKRRKERRNAAARERL